MESTRVSYVISSALILCCTFSSACLAQEKNEAPEKQGGGFPLHENRHYKVNYLGLTCGTMDLESHLEDHGGVSCYHVTMKARNSKFFNKIYKINIRIDSWVDAKSLSTIDYESLSVEKGKEHVESIHVSKGDILWIRKGKEHHFKRADDTPVLDSLAYLYRLQSLSSDVGSRPELVLLTTKGPLKTISQISGLRREKTSFGRRKTVRIHPHLADGKMFSRKGEIVLMVEPGSPAILHLLDFDLSFGHLKAKLVSTSEKP